MSDVDHRPAYADRKQTHSCDQLTTPDVLKLEMIVTSRTMHEIVQYTDGALRSAVSNYLPPSVGCLPPFSLSIVASKESLPQMLPERVLGTITHFPLQHHDRDRGGRLEEAQTEIRE